ncbi:unnamed protein product, partial [Effrenium voratum]
GHPRGQPADAFDVGRHARQTAGRQASYGGQGRPLHQGQRGCHAADPGGAARANQRHAIAVRALRAQGAASRGGREGLQRSALGCLQ